MSKVDFNQIEEIRQRADIVSIIGKYIKLSKRGANYFGICPFHADHNPSLVVSPSKKIWKCFVCGAKGNVFTFVQKYKKISFLEAVKEVATASGFDANKITFLNSNQSFLDQDKKRLVEANKYLNDLYRGFLKDPRNSEYYDYLSKKRHLSDETIEMFEFGYAPKEDDLIYKILTNKDNFLGEKSVDQVWTEKELMDAGIIYLDEKEKPTDFLINRITIPIHDNNNYVVGFSGRTVSTSSTKYLNTGTTKVFNKGNLLFNFNRVKELNSKKIIIVEGFMDAIALYNCGHKNIVATMGVALTEKHLNLLNSLELDTVILCFDNDNAGTLATIENGKKLMSNGFNTYVVGKYDKATKDVDELMLVKGPEEVNSIILNRVDFISYLIDLKLNVKLSLDEIQSNVNSLLKEIADYGDVLLRSKHFELISSLTNIKVVDLETKFKEFNRTSQSSFSNRYTRSYNNPKKSSNFNIEEQYEYVNGLKRKEDEKEPDNKIFVDYSKAKDVYWTLRSICACMIIFLACNNDYIDAACNNDIGFAAKFRKIPEVKLFVSINGIYETNGKFTLEDVRQWLKNNYQGADFADAFTYFDHHSYNISSYSNLKFSQKDKIYHQLLTRILNTKRSIVLDSLIIDALSCPVNDRDKKIKELSEFKTIKK